ncbi:HNH endonuclease family protein [Kitasatospora sp. NPDC059327]|uniref:HNH endonuclease family protein n=1 Tax=Kitasatospora sp. NPDC059327 TaxID=3346803 RepID=UPI00369CE2CE
MGLGRAGWRAAAVGSVAVLLAAAAGMPPAVAAAPARPLPIRAAAGETLTARFTELIDALPVAAEDRTGYVRTAFRHWNAGQDPADGCDTRREVIRSEALVAPEVGPKCALAGGVWFSPYDDLTITDAAGLDVDHLAPLAEAWDSGASRWSAAEREAYANDQGDPRTLIAVSARSNRQKADKDVAQWLPTRSYQCQYVQDWTAVKTRWGLSVDPVELAALHHVAADCEDVPITVTLAR